MIEIKITLSEYKKLLAIAYAAESVLEWQKEDLESMQKSMEIRPKISDFRSFYVELWPKQVLLRISVPMSYITCLDISLLHIT